MCLPGYQGEACDHFALVTLEFIEPLDGIKPYSRVAHTMVKCNGYMYMYGGYSMSHNIMGDLWKYNPILRNWTTISTGNAPNAR